MPLTLFSTLPLRRFAAALTAAAIISPIALSTAAAAAAPDGVEGEGDSSEPYLIDEAADLVSLADAVRSSDVSAKSHIALTADVDLTDEEFSGFGTFSGTIDGRGHTISNIRLGPDPETPQNRGFVHRLDGGTVKNLTFDGLSADNSESSGHAAGLAVYATDATLTGNALTGATITNPGGEKAGGLVAEANNSTIEDNFVDAQVTAEKMPAGIAAYAKGKNSIARNLVDADLTMVASGGEDGTQGNNAGLIVGYPGTPNSGSFTHNVALGGDIAAQGKVEGFLGRIIGYTGYDGWSADENLAAVSIEIAGEPVTGPGDKNQHGADIEESALAQQETYADLGWDFDNTWTFDDTLGHPVPQYSYSLIGNGTADEPFEVASVEDLEFLAQQINRQNQKYVKAEKFVLSADLDMSDRSPFPGFDRLTGELDGQGHTMTGLEYGPSESSNRLGFVRDLDGGTVRNLILDSVSAHSDSAAEDDYVAGLAVTAKDATIAGVSVIGSDLSGPNAEKVGGVVGEARGDTRIERVWVDGTVAAKKMPAGVVSYAADSTEIIQTLSTTDLEVGDDGGNGTQGIDAAHVLAYPGSGNNVSVEENVAHTGDITYNGTVPGYVGRIIGFHQKDGDHKVGSLNDNVGGADIKIAGAAAAGEEQNGADVSAEDLRKQETYEGLGWDFTEDWVLDSDLGHPIPRYVQSGDRPNRQTTTIAGDPQTGRGFTWYAENSETGQVNLSTSKDFDDVITVDADRRTGRDDDGFYQARATKLQPGTRYYYRVGDPDTGVWGRTGSFATNDGDGDFSFVDLTDTQSQNEDEAELSAATMEKAMATVPGAEFLMHNGDVVEHGDREQDWRDIFSASEETLLNTTMVPAAGNHDEADNSFVDHFALDAPGEQDTSSGAYYSFDYNAAHISVLNTNEDSDQAVSDDQIAWLEDDVKKARENGAKWTIVAVHKGPYTTANHLDDADVMGMRKALVPVIDELDIDLVLQGHDHVMSRTKSLVSDPDGVQGAAPVEQNTITELKGGKRTEYGVSPDGTMYFLPNTAGAKHYEQAKESSEFDLEEYLQLFDRTGGQETENFTGIRVEDGRLTVDVYDIRDQGQPRLFESFGIDREVAPVDEAIDALPAVDELTAADAAAVAKVRAQVDALTAAQRDGLEHLGDLEEREQRIRELTGASSTDGESISWAVDDAQKRQAVTVRNSTKSTLEDVPVKVRLEDTPDVSAEEIGFTGLDGAPLPYDVEAWAPGGQSTVWVRAKALPAQGAATIWAYYGTTKLPSAPAKVWEGDYALVEHFASGANKGETLTDATQQNNAEVVGGDLESEVIDGDGRAALGDVRLEYPGDVGGDQDRISISSVVSLEPGQAGDAEGKHPIVAKENKSGEGQSAFRLAYDGDTDSLDTRLRGNSFEFDDVDLQNSFDFPADGEDHLVTQTYDGMTYSIFIDGKEVHSEMLEYRSTYGDQSVPTTIGDFATEDGKLAAPFPGTVSEVQVAGVPFSPDQEKFRHRNLLGDAVSVSDSETKGDEAVTIAVESPGAGSTIEAGKTNITGTLSQRSQVTGRLAGDEIFTDTVDAGAFSIEMPLNALGEEELELEAKAASGGSAKAAVHLVIEDHQAPAQPSLADTSEQAQGENGEVDLSSTPDSNDREELTTTFRADATVPTGKENTTVKEGSSPNRTPDDLKPDSGEPVDDSHGTTVGEDENPYQIHTVSLDENQQKQAAEGGVHLSWQGEGDDRQVSAFLWDHQAKQWRLKDTDSDPEGGKLLLDVEADQNQNVVAGNGTVSLLIWRGLPEDPTVADRDANEEPESTAYDWGMDHVPDTQLYAQATPGMMHDQFDYLVDRSEERNTQMVLQSGDWVNREYLSQEYQWKDVDPAAQAMEEAGLPYMISWGNHDYNDERNGRKMLPKYFPHERFEKSLEGTPWNFGGSNSIDNYYYTGEIEGAKLLMLEVGFFSADDADDEGLAWAKDVIAEHPDHTVILATHQSVDFGDNRWANDNVMDTLIDPFPNVKLVLGGHIAGTGVATHERDDGSRAYGILTDYQGRVYGGQEFMRHLSVDAENGLLYSNTYSPLLDATTSDGDWNSAIDENHMPGFHGENSENFVLDLDLGGATQRTLTTSSLTMTAGEPVAVASPVETVGDESAQVVLTGVQPGVEYAWFADLEDTAGNRTRAPMKTFTLESEDGGGEDADGGSNGRDVNGTSDGGDDEGASGGQNKEAAADAQGDESTAGNRDKDGSADVGGGDDGGDDGTHRGPDGRDDSAVAGGSQDDEGSGSHGSGADGGGSGADADEAPEDDLGGQLPRTGPSFSTGALIGVAVLVIVLGAVTVAITRRSRLWGRR